MGQCNQPPRLQTPENRSVIEIDVYEQEVVDYCARAICLDTSRLNFIREQARTIYHLVRNNLRGDTRFRRTLLARKGVGKTILLSTLADAISRSPFSSMVIVIQLNSLRSQNTPKSALCKVIGVSKRLTWEEVCAHPVVRSRKVIFLIDEFNAVFHKDCLNGKEFISDVRVIGEDLEGLCHCILSGSSSILRKLITAKISMQEAQDMHLTNYSHLDLNGAKFDARTIVPFSREEDLVRLLQQYQEKYGCIPNIHLETLLVETGGFPGFIQEYCKTRQFSSSKHTIGLRILSNDQYAILESVLSAVKELVSSKTNHAESSSSEFSWVDLVDLDTVDRAIESSDLYTLADMGYLVYVEEGLSRRVGFYSARIYLEMLARSSETLSLTDLIALAHPHGIYAAHAEYAVAKILLGQTASSLLSRVLSIDTATSNKLRGQQPLLSSRLLELVLPDVSHQPELPVSQPDIPRGVFLKECYGGKKSDCFGADLAFIDFKGIVHRLQLKLGKSRMNEEDFQQVGQRFQTMRANAENAYSRVGLTLNGSRSYLLTTRPFSPQDCTCLTSYGVQLIDNKILKEFDVWPQQVKDLGKPYK